MASEQVELGYRSVFIDGPAGKLEALFWAPPADERPPLAAVVCHPHPLYGGSMHNKVVYQTAKTLRSFGLPVLRFNFRGVGGSAGTYDNGIGEEGDARAALDWLAAKFGGEPLLAAGFSFGAWVGLRAGCSDPRVMELIGLGLPVNDRALNFEYLRDCAKPKLLLIGERDQYADRAKVETLAASFPEAAARSTQIAFVSEADHFFTGRLAEMTERLAAWIEERHPDFARQER